MNKLVRGNFVEVLGDDTLTVESLKKARYLFKRETADEPEAIVASPFQRHTLLADKTYPLHTMLDPDNIFGMKILVDPTLERDEWKIVKRVEKTYVAKPRKDK